jgi:hypothetical protein
MLLSDSFDWLDNAIGRAPDPVRLGTADRYPTAFRTGRIKSWIVLSSCFGRVDFHNAFSDKNDRFQKYPTISCCLLTCTLKNYILYLK